MKIPPSRIVLCQNCGAVLPFTEARHNEDEFCLCGGQFCGCNSCNNQVLTDGLGLHPVQPSVVVGQGELIPLSVQAAIFYAEVSAFSASLGQGGTL